MKRLMAFLRFMALLCGTAMIAAVTRAGDLGPLDPDMGSRMWLRNNYTANGVVRVYKKDPVLYVKPVIVWTNAHVDVARPSMTVTQVVHHCRLQGYVLSWTTDKQGNRTSSLIKSGGPYTWVYRGWTGAYIGVGDRHGGLVWAEMPEDYVDEYTATTSRWAAAQSAPHCPARPGAPARWSTIGWRQGPRP